MSSSRTDALPRIAEWTTPTPEQFRTEILPGGQPAVLRGVALDWPLVIAARHGVHEAMSFLERIANSSLAIVLRTDPAQEGRFHYGKDVRSFNFIRGEGNIAGIIAGLREQEKSYRPFAIAAQSMDAERFFPGFSQAHPMPLVPLSAGPRVWIGNA